VPPGDWVDVWRSASADLELKRPRVVQGGGAITLPAPVDELPLLARAGTILPLLPTSVNTLYGHRGTRRVSLRIWPRGHSRFDDVVSSEKRGRRWVLRIDGRQRRRYDVQVALGTLRRPFRPCRARTKNGVTRFAVTGRRIRVELRPCRR
jgi:hypothetical protein